MTIIRPLAGLFMRLHREKERRVLMFSHLADIALPQ
jgi:hypothetical protein